MVHPAAGPEPGPDRSREILMANTPVSGLFTVAWTYDDCGENNEFESSETYTAPEAEARRRNLIEDGAYDVEIRPV
jgi:hypothetical protein